MAEATSGELDSGSVQYVDQDLRQLLSDQREFVRARDWEQFHTPKNLAMALGGEVGELACALGHLLPGSTGAASDDTHTDIVDELGDVTLYLLRLYDVTDVDPQTAFGSAAKASGRRFPTTPEEHFAVVRAVYALTGTSGRLLEAFQWDRDSAGTESRERVAADLPRLLDTIASNLRAVAELLGVNIVEAATTKTAKSAEKYPVELSRGSSKKYTELGR